MPTPNAVRKDDELFHDAWVVDGEDETTTNDVEDAADVKVVEDIDLVVASAVVEPADITKLSPLSLLSLEIRPMVYPGTQSDQVTPSVSLLQHEPDVSSPKPHHDLLLISHWSIQTPRLMLKSPTGTY